MITENVSTLKIHKLTQAQYNRELAAGNIDANALYFTPEEEIDLNSLGITATATELNYVDGVTSNVQTQLNNKMDLTSAQTASGVKTFTNGINIGDANITFDSTAGALKISFS